MIEIKSKNEIYVDKRNRAPRTGVQGSELQMVNWFVDPGEEK